MSNERDDSNETIDTDTLLDQGDRLIADSHRLLRRLDDLLQADKRTAPRPGADRPGS